MSNIIKAKTHLPFFIGFYESPLSYRLETYDLFDNPDTVDKTILDMVMDKVDEFVDYKTYEAEVGKRCTDTFMDKINEHVYSKDSEHAWLRPLIDSMKIEFAEIWSPREYNFETDECEVNIEVDIDLLKEAFFATPKAAEYLEDTHKSRPGFISFFRHDVETWSEEYVNDPDKYYVVLWSMLRHVFRWLAEDIKEEYIDDVMDSVYKNEYIDYPKLLASVNKGSGRYYESFGAMEGGKYTAILDPDIVVSQEYGNILDVIALSVSALWKTEDRDNQRLAQALRAIESYFREGVH